MAAEPCVLLLAAGVDFSRACGDHDNCYATLGTDRTQCDQAFLDAMRAECKRALGCAQGRIIRDHSHPLLHGGVHTTPSQSPNATPRPFPLPPPHPLLPTRRGGGGGGVVGVVGEASGGEGGDANPAVEGCYSLAQGHYDGISRLGQVLLLLLLQLLMPLLVLAVLVQRG